MNVLLIHQFFLEDHVGGGSRWNEMSRIWTEQGNHVTVLAGTVHYMGAKSQGRNRGFTKSKNKDQVFVIHCPAADTYGRGFIGRLYCYFSFMFSSLWAGLIVANGKYDVIVVSSPPLFVGITAMVLSRIKNIPYVFEVRDLWPESAIETGVLKNDFLIRASLRLEEHIYRKAKLISVLTPAFREALISKNIDAEKIICVPNGADFTIAKEARVGFEMTAFRKAHQLSDKFVVVYVGAHGVANQLLQIVDAAALLADTNVLFLLIGDGAEKSFLQKEVKQRNLSNVRFVKQLPKREVFQYILAADAGISVLKKSEVFKTIYSNKTFDYFSCKKPVLMAIDGLSRKLIEQADAGYFIEPECPPDFAEKVRHYLNHPELVTQHGENGYHYALRHFDRSFLAKEYLNYLIKLLEIRPDNEQIL